MRKVIAVAIAFSISASAGVAGAETNAENLRPPRLTGATFELGMGLRYLGGQFAQGFDVGAGEMTMSLRGGAYVSRRVGILGGVEGGLGFWTQDCSTPTRTAAAQ